jgi:hypothetical protein
VDLSPEYVHMASVLDTLIDASAAALLRSPAPTMTWYHGSQANRFVFSGFAPWDFRRDDAIALVDFVLQDLWGLDRRPVDRGLAGASVSRPRPAATRALRGRGTAAARPGYQ